MSEQHPGEGLGNRHNKGKPGVHLLPLDALAEIAKVYDFGAKKYDAHNWAKGLKWDEGCKASLLRHLVDWSSGIERDVESNLHHDVHIAWNAITLVAMRLRGIGIDDRFKLDTRPKWWEGRSREEVYNKLKADVYDLLECPPMDWYKE